MNTTEHIVAVVEPTADGETALDVAGDVIDRGGNATIVVAFTDTAMRDLRAAARAEDLELNEAVMLFGGDIVAGYVRRLELRTGSERPAGVMVTGGPNPLRAAVAEAERLGATSVVVPARLIQKRRFRSVAARSRVPVIVAPPSAA